MGWGTGQIEPIFHRFGEIFDLVGTVHVSMKWNEFRVMMKMISIRIGFEKIHSIDIYQIQYKKIILLTILAR